MSIEVVTRQNLCFLTLNQGHNARFPPSASDAASRIELCDTLEDIAQALQRIVSAGLRPTVRSRCHCYEDGGPCKSDIGSLRVAGQVEDRPNHGW
jgi:hypothetical protein